MVLDPDSQIRETISHFFETFARLGSAHQTVKAFRDEGLRFPQVKTAPEVDPWLWGRRLVARGRLLLRCGADELSGPGRTVDS